MRVLHIYKDYPPVVGGIENHLRLLAEGQARRGLDVTVLVTSPERSTTVTVENGVRVIRAARWATVSSAPLSVELFRWVRRLTADITHLQFPYPIGELAHLLLGHTQVTVITYQSDIVRQRWLGRLYRPFLWQVLYRADRIIATSPQYVESSPYLQRVAHKCTVVPLSIDPRPFLQVDPQQVAEVRRRFGEPLLLFVGRLRYYKGLEYLLQAMRQIDATLLVIGSGPMATAWQRRARNGVPAGRVHFLGDVPDAALINVGCGRETSINELARLIGKVTGKEVRPLYNETKSGGIRRSVADITRARRLLGWEPQIDLEEGLRRLVAHFEAKMARVA